MKAKSNITDSKVMASLDYMLNSMDTDEAKKDLVARTIKGKQLTEEFVKKYNDYIDPVSFSESYKLTQELIDKFPDKFDEEAFIQRIVDQLNPPKDDDQNASQLNGIQSMLQGMGMNFGNMPGFTGPTATKKVVLDLSIFGLYYDKIDTATKDITIYEPIDIDTDQDYEDDLEDCKTTAIEFLLKCAIRNATQEELSLENIANIFGKFDNIDQLIVTRVKDPSIIDGLVLMLTSLRGADVPQAIMSKMSNEAKEETLGTYDVSFKEFIDLIVDGNDTAWKNNMIDKAINGEIKFKTEVCKAGESLVKLFSNISTTNAMILKICQLSKFSPSSFNYEVMKYVLIYKNLGEDDLIKLIDLFKKAGLIFELKKIAKASGFSHLESLL